ncbi:MAG: BspA family leucine-rich repeat surface protein [Saprospirales bacterium]|nr:MAG: BspA family leucine-rich repeat surface protein [Saprospirales bacterium]
MKTIARLLLLVPFLVTSLLSSGQTNPADDNYRVNRMEGFGSQNWSLNLIKPSLGNCSQTTDFPGLVELPVNGQSSSLQPYSLDLGIVDIINIDLHICPGDISPKVTLFNFGTDTISSAIIFFSYNSGPLDSFNWQGSLAQLEFESIELSELSLIEGAGELLVYSSLPNGLQDENPSNDSLIFAFTVDSSDIMLTLELDNEPEEVDWAVLTLSGDTVIFGGNYTEAGQIHEYEFCKVHPCLTFKINDSGGDGICCDSGEGYYLITRQSTGDTLAFGGEFGYQETTYLCSQENTIPHNPSNFITTWQTDLPGQSEDHQITIPTNQFETYLYHVYWEEVNNPSNSGFVSGLTGDGTIDFPHPGVYQIQISGLFPRIFFLISGDKEKILSIDQWGSNPWTSMRDAFRDCSNLAGQAADAPNLINVSSVATMFQGATSFNQDIGNWDVSSVISMSGMFSGATSFNQNISSWDVSNVDNMHIMFSSATSFNQDIGSWDVSNVENMIGMFSGATSFNQDIGAWDVSSVININGMFQNATLFNQDIGAWDVSSVQTMNGMFLGATSFNQDIGNWNVSNASNMSQMFLGATSFDQNIGFWDVSNVTNMRGMFQNASSFNQNIGDWNVGKVNTMERMFKNAPSFNQDIGNWDVSAVNNMREMFFDAITFNQDIGQWNVSNVNDMALMFRKASSFNQEIGSWDVSNVVNLHDMFSFATLFNSDIGNWDVSGANFMSLMFRQATSFNQDIGTWDVSNVTNISNMFNGATSFNQDISSWDLGNVTNMQGMFLGATSFNQNIADWDLSNVNDISLLFSSATAFNQDISNWDVSNVSNMSRVFYGASSFNHELGSWNLSNVNNMYRFFSFSGLSCENYDQTLLGWSQNTNTPDSLEVGAAGLNYSNPGQSARDSLINGKGWIIDGDSFDPGCYPFLHIVSGEVKTWADVQINNVEMIADGDSVYLEYTNTDGIYELGIPNQGSWTVIPGKNENWTDGVSTLDLIIAQQHIVGLNFFDQPYLHIAADANNDGFVSTFDLVLLQNLILGLLQDISGNSSWRFIPHDHTFDNPDNPLAETWPEARTYFDLDSSLANQDYVAIKIGDVSGDAGQSGQRLLKPVAEIETRIENRGPYREIVVTASEDLYLLGYQMEWQVLCPNLDLCGFDWKNSTLPDLTDEHFHLLVDEGTLRALWWQERPHWVIKGEELFRIKINGDLTDLERVIKLMKRGSRWYSEAYIASENDIIVHEIRHNINTHPGNYPGYRLGQNEPNPFTTSTVIPFELPTDMLVELRITDASGKLIYQTNINGKKGLNRYHLRVSDLPVSLLFYSLLGEGWIDTRRMVGF